MGHLPALRVTPAAEQDRAQTGALAEAMQEATGRSVAGRSVELAYIGQGYTGRKPAAEAKTPDIRLEVVSSTRA